MRKPRWITLHFFVVALFIVAPFLLAQKAKRTNAGMDPERLARIATRMKEFVNRDTIAGAVTLVARHGVIVSLEAVGYQDLERKTPMRTDGIFQIRSMTKPVTAVGIMILLEEGRLLLRDPVEKHLPEFRDQVVADKREGEKILTTKKPARPITIRDLLTHTSGMVEAWSEKQEFSKTLAEYIASVAHEPLQFEPGTKFLYSDVGFDTLGRIIEVVSGQAYEKFVEQRILRPLGMKDSMFFPPPEKCNRIASHYVPQNGKVKRSEWPVNPDWQSPNGCRAYAGSVRYPGPSWGMFSTASDMAAFHQMMLNGGTYKGVRLLSPASVEAMTAVQTGELVPGGSWGYGLGWDVIRQRPSSGAFALASIGAYGHSGVLGTEGWVDPRKDVVAIFMVQLAAEDANTRSVRDTLRDRLQDTFITMTYAAIRE